MYFLKLNLKCIVLPRRRGTWWSTGANSTCVLYSVEQLAEAAVLSGRCQGSTQPCYSLKKKNLFKKKEYFPWLFLLLCWFTSGG